jgi:hypothetical protein
VKVRWLQRACALLVLAIIATLAWQLFPASHSGDPLQSVATRRFVRCFYYSAVAIGSESNKVLDQSGVMRAFERDYSADAKKAIQMGFKLEVHPLAMSRNWKDIGESDPVVRLRGKGEELIVSKSGAISKRKFQ